MSQLTSTVPLRPLRQPPKKVQVPLPRGKRLPTPAPVMTFAPTEPARKEELVRRGQAVEIPHLDTTIPAGLGHVQVTAVPHPQGSGGNSYVVRHSMGVGDLGVFEDLSMARAYGEGLARVAHCPMHWHSPDGTMEERTPLELDVPLVQRISAPTQPVAGELSRFIQADGSVLIPMARDESATRRNRTRAAGAAAAVTAVVVTSLATSASGSHWREVVVMLVGTAVMRALAVPMEPGPGQRVVVNTQGISCVDEFGDVRWAIPAAALESIYTDEDGSVWLASDEETRQVTSSHGAALSPLITAALLGQARAG